MRKIIGPELLHVDGDRIADGHGRTVLLRGAGLGGWMNMENFITGYPGQERQHRQAMRQVLGQEKADFFFDKFLQYFFAEDDARFFASLGLNCLRIAINYQHFEDDMAPRVLKQGGFKHLDRVINLCAAHGIYTIIDMHAAPGGQNPDWHSDNVSNYAAFWEHKDLQDRTVWLWTQIAARYATNPWVAGYNLLNEPCDAQYTRLPAFYERLATSIRTVDQHHILFLDGNTFAAEWRGFQHILPNAVYSIHDYSDMGFPTGDRFEGTPEQVKRLEEAFLGKCKFQLDKEAPIWNGEFGPVYEDPETTPDAEERNKERYALLGAQLRVYDKWSVPWSIWLYKDIGFQGMVHCSPDSKYVQTVKDFVAEKRRLNLDAWGRYPNQELEERLKPLIEWINSNAPDASKTYPSSWDTERHVRRAVLEAFTAGSFSLQFARLFEGMSYQDLEECAKSFAFKNCVLRDGLNRILSEHAGRE